MPGFLFACIEDRENLPASLRTLYAPSYNHYCATTGHAPLPADFANGFAAERISEFPHDRQVPGGYVAVICLSGWRGGAGEQIRA